MEQGYQSETFEPRTVQPELDLPIVDPTEERFYDPANRPVNMIFAIDRSGSMGNDEQRLWDNMDAFLSILNDSNIDYRIAIISTEGRSETNAGLFKTYANTRWITPSTIDPSAIAAGLLYQTAGYAEMGIDSMYGALVTNYDDNENFWRAHTPLHLVTISDEADQSETIAPWELANAILDYQESNNAPVTYSVVVNLPNPYSSCGYAVMPIDSVGAGYIRLAAYLGGNITDICEEDWTESINDLAHLATEQPYEFYLGDIPTPDSIEVLVEEGEVTFAFSQEDWVFDPIANSIAFVEYTPSNQQVVIVKYTPAY